MKTASQISIEKMHIENLKRELFDLSNLPDEAYVQLRIIDIWQMIEPSKRCVFLGMYGDGIMTIISSLSGNNT